MKPIDHSFWPEGQSLSWIAEHAQPGLVSVIIPVFNRQVYILDAIESVYSQTYRPIELIVINDGSTDHTEQAVEDWVDRHPNLEGFSLRYYRQENKGVSAARNAGLMLSTGEYIQFLDSDDLLLPSRISKCVDAMKTHQVEFVHSAHYAEYSPASSEHKGRGLVVSAVSSMGHVPDPRFYILTVAGFFSRKIIVSAGPWNESLRISEDAEYFSRVFATAESAYPISEPLVVKRKHSGPRLFDVQREYDGLESRYRCLVLRRRIIESTGYHEYFSGAWMQLAQDSLAVGFPEMCKKALLYAKNLGPLHPRSYIWRMLLVFFSYFPVPFNKKFWPKVNAARNNIKWFFDMRKGKLRQAGKSAAN